MKPVIDITAVQLPGGTVAPTGKRIPAWQREVEFLWELYCDKRDFIVALHKDCLANEARTPKLAFIFSVSPSERYRRYGAVPYRLPKHKLKWLKAAIKRCDAIIESPGGTTL